METQTQPVILIHGVPKIGKTCLARCLAYYLALEGGSTTYVKMKYSQKLDNNVVTENLVSYFGKSSWTILDQCNVNCIDPVLFSTYVLGQRRMEDAKMPIIMFTSGHCVPRPNWTQSRRVHFKVINLSVDEGTVDKLKELEGIREDEISSKDVLKVSSVIGHVYECLYRCLSWQALPMSFEQLDQVIHPIEELYSVSKEFFWLLWPELFCVKVEDIQEKIQMDYRQQGEWKIEPYQVQFLSLGMSGNLPNETQNVLLNWLSIRGEVVDEIDGYCVYESESYYFYFTRLPQLLDILARAYQEYSPVKMYRMFAELFQVIVAIGESRDGHVQAMKDYLFENMVGLLCKAASSEVTAFGLWSKGRSRTELTTVDDVVEVSSVQRLCEVTEQVREATQDRCLWCVLNLAGKHPYLGYDFAYVQVADSKYKEFQLFQVTVNPLSHATSTMYETLTETWSIIGSKLSSGDESVVEPFFLVPHGTAIGDVKKVELKHKGKCTGILASVVFLLADQRFGLL